MGYGYSVDLRTRVVAAYERGEGSYQELAARFSVGIATVNRWIRRNRETGSVDPKPHGGGNRTPFDENGLKLLEELLIATPDATYDELKAAWHAAGGARTSRSAVCRAVQKLGYSRKKSRSATRRLTRPGSVNSAETSSNP